MSQDNQILRSIIPASCPHCQKDIFVSYQMMPPSMTRLITEDEIKTAKEELEKRIAEVSFSDPKEKEEIVKWLKDETVLVSREDVEPILLQIAIKEEQLKQDATSK